MNQYEYKQEARRLRLERAAERAKSEGNSRLASADRLAEVMNGQPILVGHHSEKRHRRDIAKMWRNMGTGFAKLKEAEELARRADAVGTGGISSDNPEAPNLLRAKVEALSRQRDRIKAVNAFFRKHKTLDGFALEPGEAEEINRNRRIWTGMYGAPYPPYVLTNLGARIRQAEQRAKDVETLAKAEPSSETVNGVTVAVDPEDNRVSVTFPRRLSRDEYKRVRSFGFLWSPTRGAFVRKVGNGALSVALVLAKEFKP